MECKRIDVTDDMIIQAIENLFLRDEITAEQFKECVKRYRKRNPI